MKFMKPYDNKTGYVNNGFIVWSLVKGCSTNFTLRCQIKRPPLINFSIFFQPPGPHKDPPRLLMLRNLTVSTNPSFHFLSLLVLFTPNFHGKIAYCCIHFSFMLYDNLFFFSSLYNNLKPFLKFRPPRLF